MKALIQVLNTHINDLISLHFYRKVEGVMQKTADASYSVYLKSLENSNDFINIKFTNGMNSAGKSDFTVTLPLTASVTRENDTTWKIEYTVDTDILIVRLFLPLLTTNEKNISSESKQGIVEKRNKEGELEKLIIETPDSGVTIEFLSLVKNILTHILTTWKTFVVSSTENTEEENKVRHEFISLESVNLPGNTFIELQTNTPKGISTIEVSTSMTIDTQELTILYRLDDVTYTLKRSN